MGSTTEDRVALLRIMQYRWPIYLSKLWFYQFIYHHLFTLSSPQFYPGSISSELLQPTSHWNAIYLKYFSWDPAVQSLGKKQEMFLHKGKVSWSSLQMLEKDKKWKNQTNKKIPFMAERQCIVFGAKNVWNQKDNAILSSNPAVISSSCNICHPPHCDAIYLKYIWKYLHEIKFCAA